jgi:hypothetical protein
MDRKSRPFFMSFGNYVVDHCRKFGLGNRPPSMGLIAAKVETPDIPTTVSIMTYDIETYQGDHPFKRID